MARVDKIWLCWAGALIAATTVLWFSGLIEAALLR